jgi:tryptophan synthase alpha chain
MSLAQAFATARAEDRAALICYLPAGFPDAQTSVALIDAMVDAGADVVEVGLPYSDPLMDGPVIQQAVDVALAAGTTTDTVLQIVREVSGRGAQIAVMSYWNPIERYGVERFAEALVDSGGVAVITPDLTPEEAGPWIAATDAAGVERVFLVAPSSTDDRISTVAEASSGFVYAASTMGVTGARATLGTAAGELVGRVRPRTHLPIAVGVGVSTPEQAREVAGYADGVIVGSALVRAALDAPDRDAAVAAVASLTAALAEGVRG